MSNVIISLAPFRPSRQCGPECYNSADNTKSCICQGLNRNAGYRQSLLNNLANVQPIIKRWLHHHGNQTCAALMLQLPEGCDLTIIRGWTQATTD